MIELGSKLGADLCEALGLDPKLVGSLRLVFRPDQPVTAHVVLLVKGEQGDRLRKVIRRYRLELVS